MRALFRSKGLETGAGGGDMTSRGYLQMVFALHWPLTPDMNNTCRFCAPTHTYLHLCHKALLSPVRAGGLKPEPKPGLKPDFCSHSIYFVLLGSNCCGCK